MDADYTFNSCSGPMEEHAASTNACTGLDWTREEDKAFEDALANYFNAADLWDKIALAVPGKTIQDLKLHYEALIGDVKAIESGKVHLPNYPSKVHVHKERQSPRHGEQARGTPWTEEEHRQFLYGLERFGRGDWKSISRYNVRTKSNSQVASHAQKYFNRLSAVKEDKRLSINDIRTVNHEKLLALEKATTSCMPECCKEKLGNAGIEEVLPGSLEEASTHAVNQLLPQDPMEVSMDAEYYRLSECPNNASADATKQPISRWLKRASTVDGNEFRPRDPEEASTGAGKQVVLGFPDKVPTDSGNQWYAKKSLTDTVSGYAKRARTEIGYQSLPPPPSVGICGGSPFSGQAFRTDTGNKPKEASFDQLLPLPPFAGMSHDTRFSEPMLPAYDMPSPPFAIEPIQQPQPSIQHPGVSIKTPGFYPTDVLMEDADARVDGEFDSGSSTDIVDLDMSMFPHF